MLTVMGVHGFYDSEVGVCAVQGSIIGLGGTVGLALSVLHIGPKL